MRMSKHSSCLIHRNFLAGISYSDATPGQSFVYDHLGQLTQITDAAGMRTFACNLYGEPETDSLAANGIAWQVSERYDGLGRQAGYELSADGRRVQQARLSYDGKGRLSTLAAEGMETPFSWTYCEQGGLVEQLAYPNGMTRVNTYEDGRDLLSVIDYQRPGSANPPARHEYDYDALGRPTRRRDTWNTAAPKTTRLFTYNSRGELVGDQLRPGGRFGYQYDNIGNRKEAFEFGSTTDYETDELNRYAGIVRNGGEAFTPQYDADGNQTLVKTSTGIWTVTYNAENRPVKFESEDGGTTVECAYDSMGRRFEKKVTVGGTTGFHARYLYRDYLQVAECDLTGETPKLVRSYLWDPSEPEATRVLAMTRWEANGTQVKEHLYCMHDAMKNVTSLFGEARGRRALYEYRPYGGLVTSEGNMAQENKFRFSSEYMDDELGLIYYNYRHLNPRDGRWISRDPIMEQGGWNLFGMSRNNTNEYLDWCGLQCVLPIHSATGAPGYNPSRGQGSVQCNPFRLNYTPPSNNEVTPFQLGIEWLTGVGPRHRDFKDNDDFAERMRSHDHIQKNIKEIEKIITEKCKNDCSYVGPYTHPRSQSNYNLGGVEGVINYLGDYSNVITFGQFGNLAVTFTGSYSAVFTVSNIDCCKNTADLLIVLNNRSHAASALRPPILGYTSWWQTNFAPLINQLFSTGPGSPTTQTVTLKEKLKLSSDCSSK